MVHKKMPYILAGIPHFDVTDHNLLISILTNRRLDEIENPRLQQMRTSIMAYNFTAHWRKSAQRYAAGVS